MPKDSWASFVMQITRFPQRGAVSYRQFEDEHGQRWDVWEVHPSAVERRVNEERRRAARATPDRRANQDVQFPMPPELANGWLAFQCADTRRRLAPIPPHWEAFSDEELRELARRAQAPRAASRPPADHDLRPTSHEPEVSRGQPRRD